MRTNKVIDMALTTSVVALVFLLGAGAAEAATVNFDPADSDKAIGITNLDIDGTPYNVAFTTSTTASDVYGAFPGVFDFTTSELAEAALDAVNALLTGESD